MLTFRTPIPVGENDLLISGLKDFYGSPISTDIVRFFVDSTFVNQEFFISSFKIENPYLVQINFNLNVDETSVVNTANYVFEPDNQATEVRVDENNKKIIYVK